MSKTKEVKTNAMRMLDRMKIPYEAHTYECEEFVDGIQVADMLHLPHEKVYKTLVTVGNSKNYFVFVLPIEAELDLKKAAREVGEKSLAMVHVKDITALQVTSGGGCTAIGMKKRLSPGLRQQRKISIRSLLVVDGLEAKLELKPEDLKKACKGEFADITV